MFHVPRDSVGLRTVTLGSRRMLKGVALIGACRGSSTPQIQQELRVPGEEQDTWRHSWHNSHLFFPSLSPAKWSPKSQGLVQVVQTQADTTLGHSGISSRSL